jgi:hypothetical protein
MAVYIDNFYVTGAGDFGRMKMSHMVADTTDELLKMADAIGVKRKWIQHPDTCNEHFDICMSGPMPNSSTNGPKRTAYRGHIHR